MRSKDFGVVSGLSEKYSKETSLELFRKMCVIRYFEQGVIESVQAKYIDYLVYISSGLEPIAADLSVPLHRFMSYPQTTSNASYLPLA